jgi:hypothetical protein
MGNFTLHRILPEGERQVGRYKSYKAAVAAAKSFGSGSYCVYRLGHRVHASIPIIVD